MAAERSETQRMWIEGSTLGVGVILAVALFGMVNYLSLRHYQRLDWTSAKLYSLSEKSERVLRELDRDIDAVIFISPSSELFGPANELLENYAAAHPRFKKRVIDPARNLLEARKLVEEYSVQRTNVIVIASGDDRRIIDEFDLAELDYSGAQMGQGPTLKEFKGEQLITSAILELIEAKKPKILTTRGHGEANGALSRAKTVLGNDNFEFEEWNPAESLAVPEDADLIVVAAPSTRFFEPELDLFGKYLEEGGRMLFLLDPRDLEGRVGDPLLSEWLSSYGVEVGDNVVVDPNPPLLYGPESLLSASYGSHVIVENLDKGQRPVLLRWARSIAKADDAPGEYEVTELVRTAEDAWGETDLENVATMAADEGEVQGPVSLAVAVSFQVRDESAAGTAADEAAEEPEEASDEPGEAASEDDGQVPEARLVVFGDLDFAGAEIENAANSEFLVNTFNWLVQREQLIAIEGRKPRETKLALAPEEYGSIYMIVTLLLPGLAMAAGVSTYLRRRR